MMPAPSHLRNWTIPSSNIIDESNFKGSICCPCGNKELEIYYPGETTECKGEIIPCVAEINKEYFFIIRVKCIQCQTEHIIFDMDFHGWDGYVCHDKDKALLPRPELKKWTCLDCNSSHHTAIIELETQGKDDFIEETDGEFPPEKWSEGFSWFTLHITCSECNKFTKEWVSYETM